MAIFNSYVKLPEGNHCLPEGPPWESAPATETAIEPSPPGVFRDAMRHLKFGAGAVYPVETRPGKLSHN